MPTIVLQGPAHLRGTLSVDGSKNAALPSFAASLLTTEPVHFRNVPPLQDVSQMLGALRELGADVRSDPALLEVSVSSKFLLDLEPNPDRIRKMRASFLLLAPLLWRRGRVTLPLPGGCTIGPRPVDLHLKGLEALGAEVRLQPPMIHVSTPLDGLRGAEIDLPYPSVGATEQLLLASSLACGRTILHGAATEPEVSALVALLRSMGVTIDRHEDTLVIHGKSELRGTSYVIPPDRIEAGTLLLAAVATRSELTLVNAPIPDLIAVLDVLEALGAQLPFLDDTLSIAAPQMIHPLCVEARPFPGFPTDLQPILVATLATADGESTVRDSVFPERFGYVSELNRLGAGIIGQHSHVIIPGKRALTGGPVTAGDLRAGAALVIAGLSASGTTTILDPHHIDRGYVGLEQKLSSLGAIIERQP
ncbi:UDP-N-acetylglucosamine 1-carboxyvinyltransferase [Candidatus Bipolaricaulota bacterium]|nr:UDP-N-acetylglucosamine 1-carboxyvinyltransferase [Candidatus Bipolaricaulota bacterium]